MTVRESLEAPSFLCWQSLPPNTCYLVCFSKKKKNFLLIKEYKEYITCSTQKKLSYDITTLLYKMDYINDKKTKSALSSFNLPFPELNSFIFIVRW